MLPARRLHRYTYADYVAVELESTTKHEFLDGEIYAMAGGSEEHSALAAAVITALQTSAQGGPCRVHTADLRIYVEAVGLATFPDGSLICGGVQQHGPSPRATALNPKLLLEVTSDSSLEYDTQEKLEFYRTIPSLQDYVIVSHRERRICVYSRVVGDSWKMRVAVSGGAVALSSLDLQLSVDTIYAQSAIR